MKRTLRGILSAALVAVLIFSVVGCAESNNNASSGASDSGGSTTSSNSGSTSSKGGTAQTNAPVKISIITTSVGATVPGVQDDQVAKEIEKKTGITMDITNVSGDISQKILPMNSSGDLPCLVNTDGNKDTLKTLVDSGSILDLTDLIKTHGQNFLNNPKLKFAVDFSKKFDSFGSGKLYEIPIGPGVQSSPNSPTAGAYIRWDYYKELGYPKVNNIMDLLPVLKQMQEKHPKASNGKSAYGVGFWSDWDLWPVNVFGFIDGYAEGDDTLGTIDISTNQFVPSFASDNTEFWKYITFYNKAYQMGILDPDSATQKYSDYAAKVAAGQEYFEIPGWLNHSFQGTPDQGFALIDTTGGSDKAYSRYGNDAGFGYYAISKGCKAPERAMDLLNFLASRQGTELVTNGVQGQTWDLVDGKPVMKDNVMKIVQDPKNKDGLKYGYSKYGNMAGLAADENDPKYNIPFNFTYAPDYIASHQTNMEKDQANFYGVKISADIYNKKKYNTYGNVIIDAMPVIDDPKYKEEKANIQKYVDENWLKLVYSKNDAEFNSMKKKFTKDVYDMGYQDVINKFTKNFNDTKAIVESLNSN